MKTRAGVWIDHRKAVIVTVSGHAETLLEILSGVESQPSRENGVPMDVHFESLLEKADDYHQSDYTEQLNQYYAKVDAAVHKTASLLIFGPGEAKGELKKRLEHAGYAAGCWVGDVGHRRDSEVDGGDDRVSVGAACGALLCRNLTVHRERSWIGVGSCARR